MKIKKLLLIFLTLALVAFYGCKQNVNISDSVSMEEQLPFSEDVLHGTLDNGLQYYIMKNEFPSDKVELRLNVRTGSLNENENELGIAHFVEHLAFNGTRDYPDTEVVKFMERAGLTFGQHSNAYTSQENTQYMLTIPASDKALLTESFSILRNWADGVLFDADEVEREKGIIVEEWRMRNTVGRRIYQKLAAYMQAGSLYPKRMPIGDMDIVRNADRELLKGYYDKWYTANNMSVIVVGNMDVNEAEVLIKKNFASMEDKNTPKPADKNVPLTKGLRVEMITDPESTSTSVSIMYIFESKITETYSDLKTEALLSAAISMFNSRINTKISDTELDLLGLDANINMLSSNLAMLNISLSTTPERLNADTDAVLAEIQRVVQHGFSESEVQIYETKMMSVINKRAEPDFAAPSNSHVYNISNYDTYGTSLTDYKQDQELYSRFFDEAEASDYKAAFINAVNAASQLVVVVSSDANAEKIVISKSIWADKVAEATRKDLTPPDNIPVLYSLMVQQLIGGEIVQTTRYPAIDAVKVKYSNGIELFIKPNQYESKRFAMTGLKSGGNSVLSDKDVKLINFAPSIVLTSGVKGIPPKIFKTFLADKQLSINMSSSKTSFAVILNGASADVASGFELLYTYYRDFTVDENVLQSSTATTKESLLSSERNKQTIFNRKVAKIIYNSEYRPEYMQSIDLDNITADYIYKLFQENFADASNYTYVISGDVDVNEIIELGRVYLGSLPVSAERNKAVDSGVHLAKQKGSYTGNGDVENKTTITIYMENRGIVSEYGDNYAVLFSNILRQRMREEIREEMGGAYSVMANMHYIDYPDYNLFGMVALTCDPQMQVQILDKIDEIFTEIKENGITREELETAVKQYQVQLISSNESNSYWVNKISQNYMKGAKIKSTQEITAEINSHTVEGLNSFIKEYMDGIKSFTAIYNPENYK